ncbi:hypothetical protein V7x_38530 [Crateriforma conspicua]|uniref:Uncharacterized protein n=1 Tax=Crateriforma conspicua TaxID=2527996 RepID=A0A5C6FLD2_9PLAN|nr:hypothetical protein V7x_38530 [Crateriforma conspicua]
MKRPMRTSFSILLLIVAWLATAHAEPPKMKMTTEVPSGIATPDKL